MVPEQKATKTAASVPVASMTASVSSAIRSASYAASVPGRSVRPLPRASKVTTR